MNVMAKNVVAKEAVEASVTGPRILLVIGGGIAAYKSCELVRLIRKGGGDVTCVLTDAGSQFVTPMSLGALSGNQVHTSLWDLKDEVEIGHIELSRQADLVVVCPATADLLAKMAAGIADDLGTTLILATDKPVLAVPAMNVKMWEHEATTKNVDWLRQAGVRVMQPDDGEMACGEFGPGRLPDPEDVWLEIADALGIDPGDARAEEIGEFLRRAAAGESAYEEDEDFRVASPIEGEEVPEEVLAPVPAEKESAFKGGLSSLIASIIPRSSTRRIEEDEAAYAADFAAPADNDEDTAPEEPEDEPAGDEAPTDETPAEAGDAQTPAPAEFGSLLAMKGGARSAPPTDLQALNHVVSDRQAPPEKLDRAPTAVLSGAANAGPIEIEEVLDDPLEGQPEFDADPEHRPLYGKHVLVTAGPTHEAIDPVRYIANRSSGRQGFAIAAAAAAAGARVTLVAGPVRLKTPPGVDRIDVESAEEMAKAVKEALPADVAVMVAAVADWRTKDYKGEKIKKRGSAPPALLLTENPDILAGLSASDQRPGLLIGFAAETENVVENARKKRKSKGVDWIVANDVSGGDGENPMGGSSNTVHIVREKQVDTWDTMPKGEVARKLVERIAEALED